MPDFIAFIQSVGVDVTSYFICKWLDWLLSKYRKHK